MNAMDCLRVSSHRIDVP